jgi:hypothetical protein
MNLAMQALAFLNGSTRLVQPTRPRPPTYHQPTPTLGMAGSLYLELLHVNADGSPQPLLETIGNPDEAY